MTNEEAKEIFLNRGFVNGFFDGDKWRESIVVISKWLEQAPCEDCISRQAVLEIAKSSKSNWIDNSVLFKRVNELPPVVPKPKTNVLDKIRAEIDQKQYDFMSDGDYDEGIRFGLMLAYQIIDKYKAESEDKE